MKFGMEISNQDNSISHLNPLMMREAKGTEIFDK